MATSASEEAVEIIPKTVIGKRIDDLRIERGLSRKDLARYCDRIPVSFNRHLVNSKIDADLIQPLSKVLECSMTFLLTGKKDSRIQRVLANLSLISRSLESKLQAIEARASEMDTLAKGCSGAILEALKATGAAVANLSIENGKG